MTKWFDRQMYIWLTFSLPIKSHGMSFPYTQWRPNIPWAVEHIWFRLSLARCISSAGAPRTFKDLKIIFATHFKTAVVSDHISLSLHLMQMNIHSCKHLNVIQILFVFLFLSLSFFLVQTLPGNDLLAILNPAFLQVKASIVNSEHATTKSTPI